MKRFVLNVLLFTVVISSVSAGVYWLVDKYYMPKGDNIYYIWGDSQMYQGLDLQYLAGHTPYKFCSAAAHGASLYDFLVFAEKAPLNSHVIIAISKPALLRKKESDRNSSAINLSCLNLLLKNNYSLGEVYDIFMNNFKPKNLFETTNILYDNSDTIKQTEAFSLFEKVYAQKPSYFDDKERLYIAGIEKLKAKHCHITAIVFPNHTVLTEIELKSPYVGAIINFKKKVSGYFEQTVTLDIPTAANVFYDYTHLNKRGAASLSAQLVPVLESGSGDKLVEVICK